jgi:hypothetical protein
MGAGMGTSLGLGGRAGWVRVEGCLGWGCSSLRRMSWGLGWEVKR